MKSTHSPLLVLREINDVLLARKWTVLAILFAIVLVGMAVTLSLPQAYESSIKILVSRERVDPRVTAGANPGDLARPEMTDEEFNSEIEIIQSREVLGAVVAELELASQIHNEPSGIIENLKKKYLGESGAVAASPYDLAIKKIADKLEVTSIKKSRIIKVTYRDGNPERTARILNTLFQKYADRHLQLHQKTEAANVFRSQSETFNNKLEEVTAELKKFDAQNNTLSVNTQKELLLHQLYEAQDKVNSARSETKELEQRIITINSQLSTQPERIETGTVTKYVAALDKMKEEVVQLELQLTQLRQKYLPGHRLIQELEQRINKTREMIAREERNPPQEKSFALNDVHRHLTNDLLTTQANLAAVREREKQLSNVVAQYRTQLTQLDQNGFKKSELERERALNEEAYLLYQKKAQEADISNALNRSGIVNVSLAESAAINEKPVSPNVQLNLIVLLVIGALAGIAGAVFIERLNPVIRSAASTQQKFGLDILAEIHES